MYNKEKSDLYKSYLNRTTFKAWKEGTNPNYQTVELYINSICDQKCTYCYLWKHKKDYFPPGSENNEKIMNNLVLFLDWLDENEMRPEKFEIFSGEIFSQQIGFDIVELLFKRLHRGQKIIVPSNMNFLFNDEKTEHIKKLFEISQLKGIAFHLSASVDGPYMEENRKIINKQLIRTPEWYDKLFTFAKQYNCGFHPMIYSKNIKDWKENWLWFQKNLKEYDIPYHNIYLLEIRDYDWNDEQIKDFSGFLEFLYYWLFDFCNHDKELFIKELFKNGFNILKTSLSTIGRGIGCSIQSTFTLRLGDLTIVPCHRLAYDFMETAKFVVDNNKIVDIEGKNIELGMSIATINHDSMPFCETCIIKDLCNGGCLGSQFETTGDVFTPIPTVCKLEHVKVITMLKALNRIGVLSSVINRVSENKKIGINMLLERGEENGIY